VFYHFLTKKKRQQVELPWTYHNLLPGQAHKDKQCFAPSTISTDLSALVYVYKMLSLPDPTIMF
jgi:hypothetical protein